MRSCAITVGRFVRSQVLVLLFGALLVVSVGGGTLSASAASLSYVPADCTRIHVVNWGDWLSRITPNWRAVAQHDHLPNANLIFPGERLCVAWALAAHPQVVVAPAGAPAPHGATPVVNRVLNLGPCAGRPVDFSNAAQWAVPHGCYGGVYAAVHGPYWGYYLSPGYCNEFAEAMHPWFGRSDAALHLPGHGGYAPQVGATIWYDPGVQGASSDGHYSVVIAVGPNGWVLSGDENFYWRGGGFNRVIYRFVHVSAGLQFRY